MGGVPQRWGLNSLSFLKLTVGGLAYQFDIVSKVEMVSKGLLSKP